MEEFGEKLRKAREAKGMTQQSLAEKLYVTRQAVSRWEHGERFPDLITTRRISQILDVKVDDLLSDNEMKTVAERNSIIETPFMNNITITLFAFVLLAYIVSIVNTLIRNPFRSISMDSVDIWIIGIHLLSKTIQTGIFAFGLVMAVKGMLSPKKTGVIASVFFITVCMMNSCQMLRSVTPEHAFIIGLIVIPGVTGAIASYAYFYKAKTAKIWTVLISVVSVWEMLRTLLAAYLQIEYAGQYVSMNTALGMTLNICIYILIIYQVYILKRKRSMALEMSQKSAEIPAKS